MRNFVHRENIRRYKQMLERATDEAERHRLLKLLAEEEARPVEDAEPPKQTRAEL